jgi:hypothetical protein
VVCGRSFLLFLDFYFLWLLASFLPSSSKTSEADKASATTEVDVLKLLE